MNSRTLLAASLGANVVLFGLWLLKPGAPATSGPSVPEGPPSGTRLTAASATPPSSASPPNVPAGTNTVRRFNWEQVESADYRQYIANLRAIGCPDQTIRDIIIADVTKLYDEKKKAARGGPKKFEFWKSGNPFASILGTPETMQKMRTIETEKNAVLRTLGIEPDSMSQLLAASGGNPMDTMFDFLPEAKRTRITEVMAEFQEKLVDSAANAATDPESMMKTQREMEQAIKASLSPEEFLDYQLRFSATANMLRSQLGGFEPSEAEFLAVFKLRAEFDDVHSPVGTVNASEAQQKERAAAQKQLDQAIRETLGEARFNDYQRSQDHNYQQVHRIVTKANLPTSVANDVYDMRKVAEAHAQELRRDPGLSPDQRNAALQATRLEVERSIQQALGPEAWEQFNRPNNTWWLRTISPNPPTPTPP